jgi:large subunit ribosomal protein L23
MSNLKPFITEKTVQQAKLGQFTLIMDEDCTKAQIKSQVFQIFKVDVLSVRIIKKKPVTSKKTKGLATKKGFKKAIITLKKGDVMPGYDSFLKPEKDAKKSKNKMTKVEKK